MMESCRKIFFPKIEDARGSLSFIEEFNQAPFEIKRVYYLYDVPSGATRGGHAHLSSEQIIIALSGSFDVVLDDGRSRESVFLNRPHYGLYIPPGIWRELENFSSNCVVLSLASTLFNESDYIREYDIFKQLVVKGNWK
jgi:dTDP-4-dehydrorhamnose 3,5-epimerase-like enzyme